MQKGIFGDVNQDNNKKYVVLQVSLKEKFLGTGFGNLFELENVINSQAAKGYRLHTIATSNGDSKGFGGGDRIQATLVKSKKFDTVLVYKLDRLRRVAEMF